MMLKLFRLSKQTQIINFAVNNYAMIIKMPSLSPTMTEGGIVKWYKNVGDKVEAGDLIVDIQTDKAVVGLEAEDDGILAKIIKPNDSQNLKIGTMIGLLAEEDEDWQNIEVPVEEAPVDERPVESKTEDTVVESKNINEEDERIGPAVRRLLETYGIDSNQVTHSGPKMSLLKSDVMKYIDDKKLSPIEQKSESVQVLVPKGIPPSTPSTAPFTDIELTNMRQVIAKRMVASKTAAPHLYTTGEARIDRLLALRKSLKNKSNISVSVNDFIIKACAHALRMAPEINSTSAGGQFQFNRNVDISVAVATESGLITPIVFGADQLTIEQVGGEVRRLALKAKQNKLQPNEFMGGTFTISNLGMFGIKQFTAIINAPQSAILAVGSGLPELNVNPDNNDLETRTLMRFTLSSNAQFINQNTASYFLSQVSKCLENPEMLLADAQQEKLVDACWGY